MTPRVPLATRVALVAPLFLSVDLARRRSAEASGTRGSMARPPALQSRQIELPSGRRTRRGCAIRTGKPSVAKVSAAS